MLYRYEAVDKTGKVVRGAMKAPDEQFVAKKLATMGYSLQSIQATGKGAGKRTSGSPAAPVSGTTSFPVSVAPSVRLSALVVFYRRLATLVRAGIPLSGALDDLAQSLPNRKLRRAAVDLRERVRQGDKLSSAMAAYPHRFPVHSTGLIWGGELGGYLDIALDDAATELEQEAKDRLHASIGWYIAKISLVLLIVLIPAVDFKGMLVNGLSRMAELAGNPALELGSQDLIPVAVDWQYMLRALGLGYWMAFQKISLPILILWVVGSFVWPKLKRMPDVRRAIDSAILKVPAWGGLHRERSLERFLKSLYQQYKAGVPPAQAWAAASLSVRNSELAARLRGLERLLRQPGGTLQQAFMQSGVFSQDDIGIIGSGERAGSVPEMLERLADYHGDAAGGAKSKGRMASVHTLLLVVIISTGYVLIRVVQGYIDLTFGATKLLGLE